MARMIPASGPREHTDASKEGKIYESLSLLPDDFIVVHSLEIVNVLNDSLSQGEGDFVVFHKDLGLLCIEAKAGQVGYREGNWRYSSGLVMKHGGPFKQAAQISYKLMDLFRSKKMDSILNRCKIMHAVWFASVYRDAILSSNLPPDVNPRLILTAEDLFNPERHIREIMSLKVGNRETKLDPKEEEAIVTRILCPHFDITPTKRLKYDLADTSFARLLDSQKRVLDFLEDQHTAAIAGVAGSGKTLIALERARRLSEQGDRVLFLCFNALLGADIAQRCEDVRNIDAKTIAGFACSVCRTSEPDYELLVKMLKSDPDRYFPFDHVIVDEGQDFGSPAIEGAGVLDTLNDLVQRKEGTLYVFYDRNQLVQGTQIPAVINDADCKITLYVNCRNTRHVAESSKRSLPDGTKIKLADFAPAGSVPLLFASADTQVQTAYIDKQIAALRADGIGNICILTCKTEGTTAFKGLLKDSNDGRFKLWKDTGVKFVSCRRFKGLEADAVILVDIDFSLWGDGNSAPIGSDRVLYTGISRAKHALRLVCSMDDSECARALEAMGRQTKKSAPAELARALGALYSPL